MSDLMAAVDDGFASGSGADAALLAIFDRTLLMETVANLAPVFGLRYGALVLVRDDDLWFGARFGFTEAVTPREGPLWDAAMSALGTFCVDDLLADPRFASGPHTVGGRDVRFFTSSVFRSPDGRAIGVVSFADPDPQEFSVMNQQILAGTAAYIETELAAATELERAAEVQRALFPRRFC